MDNLANRAGGCSELSGLVRGQQVSFFDDLVTDEEAIRRVKVGESHTERVFVLEGIERYPGPFGPRSGRTADGSWTFVRDRSTQEVYRLSVELP